MDKDPQEYLNQRLANGVSKLQAIRDTRQKFELTLAQVKLLLPSKKNARLQSREELVTFLGDELSYCGCSYFEEALFALRDILHWAEQSERDELPLTDNPHPDHSLGLVVFFLYLLDGRDFIDHGGNLNDATLTAKGRLVLVALREFVD